MSELQQIAEIMGTLGDDARSAFLWYLAYRAFENVFWAGFIILVGRTTWGALKRWGMSEKQRRDEAGLS